MEKKYGFLKMTLAEFKTWLQDLKVSRTILTVQQHHTFNPDYSLFNGKNHFAKQRGMWRHHTVFNGWSDIGQHFTTFPDGTIVTGRTMERNPACIFGNNRHAVCIEHLGNFDDGNDIMTEAQKKTAVEMTAALCQKFSLEVNTNKIVYHHWFRLDDGRRNNGKGGNKSCPGTNFFGGNKVEDCEANFLPLVRQALNNDGLIAPAMELKKYACVTANFLNVRQGPKHTFKKVVDRDPAELGAVLRVYDIQNNWYRISSSKEHWVSGKYTMDVTRATVNVEEDDELNVRNGPKHTFQKVGALKNGQEVFIQGERDNWVKLNFQDGWVNKRFLDIEELG